MQNFFEVVLEQFQQMIDDVIGPEGRRYLPLIATLGLFILAGNLMGLVPGHVRADRQPEHDRRLRAGGVLRYHYIGVRSRAGHYLQALHGAGALALAPLMFLIEIISHLARPLSLTLRLFGNMFGGHILLAIIFFLMGLDGLIGWALSGSRSAPSWAGSAAS